MKIIAEIVTAIILLATGLFVAPNLISEFRMKTLTEVNEGLSEGSRLAAELSEKNNVKINI